MMRGISLQALSQEIQRQRANKRDYLTDTRHLRIDVRAAEGGTYLPPSVRIKDDRFGLNEYALFQMADSVGIPRKYVTMLQEPKLRDLLAENLNTLFYRQHAQKMVRTMDGTVRAFVSNRYRVIDNDLVVDAVLPELMNEPAMQVAECNISERLLTLKVLFPRIQSEVKPGDVVQLGLVVTNSEIGAGAFSVRPLIYRLICANGMIRDVAGGRRVHLGRGVEAEEAREVYRDVTLQADDRALILKLQDTVRSLMKQHSFDSLVADLRESTTRRLESPIADVVEVTAKRYGLVGAEKDSLLEHLAMGGDFTQYGLANAVTRMAQDVTEFDRSTELERVGGQIIELPQTSWRELAQAA